MRTTKIMSLLLAVVMLLGIMPHVSAEGKISNAGSSDEKRMIPVLYGDLTQDGVINTGDAVYLLRVCNDLIALDTEYRRTAADANRNGFVNTGDVVTVLRVCLGLEEEAWTEIGRVGDEYTVTLRFFDGFNDISLSAVDYTLYLPEGSTEFTLNNENFADYIEGYELYQLDNYEKKFTMSNGVITPNVIECRSCIRKVEKDVNGEKKPFIVVSSLTGLDRGIRQDLAGYYVLDRDIDLTLTAQWLPIGWTAHCHYNKSDYEGKPFTGVFDGNGHYIYNLNGKYGVENEGSSFVGFFAYNEGVIKNVTFGLDILKGTVKVGAVAAYNKGVITNVHVKSTSYSGVVESTALDGSQYPGTGGIVGYNDQEGTISQCSNSLKYVQGSNECGGICGTNDGLVEECWSTSGINVGLSDSILGGEYYAPIGETYHLSEYYNYAGGLVGHNVGVIQNCYVDLQKACVAADFVGGFVGVNFTNGVIQNCWLKDNGKVKWCTVYTNYASAVDMPICSIYGSTVLAEAYIIDATATPKYFTSLTSAQFSAYTNDSPLVNWDLTVWDFGETGDLPYLINNPQPVTES